MSAKDVGPTRERAGDERSGHLESLGGAAGSPSHFLSGSNVEGLACAEQWAVLARRVCARKLTQRRRTSWDHETVPHVAQARVEAERHATCSWSSAADWACAGEEVPRGRHPRSSSVVLRALCSGVHAAAGQGDGALGVGVATGVPRGGVGVAGAGVATAALALRNRGRLIPVGQVIGLGEVRTLRGWGQWSSAVDSHSLCTSRNMRIVVRVYASARHW